MKTKPFFILTLVLILTFIISSFIIIDQKTNRESTPAINEFSFSNPEVDNPIVFMTTDISSKGLMAIYKSLGRTAKGKVAVKIHTGEPGGHNFLSPDLIKELVQFVNGTIVECNTAYGGSRAGTSMHKQVAKDHGFTSIAPVDILDEEGYISLPVPNGNNIQEDFVGSHFTNYDFFIILSHFKGHAMGGFGGAIKNMSIGLASRPGKSWIHTAGNSMDSPWGGAQDPFLESMAEAAYAVADTLGENIIYINVMNNLSVDCDCDNSPADPTMADIGILGSLDPVALDQACVELVYAAPDGNDLIQRIESRNGIHTLDHGEEIGLGSKSYSLISIDSTSSTGNYLESNLIYIYPNPSNLAIHIRNSENFDLIKILDFNGRTVVKLKSVPEISVNSLKQGTYLIQFIAKNRVVAVTSFIRE
jgi:uncharacterized protein